MPRPLLKEHKKAIFKLLYILYMSYIIDDETLEEASNSVHDGKYAQILY